MKAQNIILVAILILATSSVSYSQFYKGFGIKGGVTYSNQSLTFTDPAIDIKANYKYGFTAGIFKEINVFKNLQSQFEINYIRKGYLMEITNTNEFGEYIGYNYYHDNLNFLSLEANLKYDFPMTNIKPYLLGGLRLDIYSSQESFNRKINGTDTDMPGIPVQNNKIFGATLGAGCELPITKLFSTFLEIKYSPDFTNLFQNDFITYRGYSIELQTGIKF